jgi:integrase
MKTALQPETEATGLTTGENVIPLAIAPRPAPRPVETRFKIKPFVNPRTHTPSWRVEGIKRDGARIRENCADEAKARCRQIELETEYLKGHVETAVRATKLSERQIALAESSFIRLGDGADEELPLAVDYWLRLGRQNAVAESPRLDEAAESFLRWLEETESLRHQSKGNLRRRIDLFRNSVGDIRVCDFTPKAIDDFLDKRDVSTTTKDNDRRAISRFFSWCMDRKRGWTAINPCHAVKVERTEKPPPSILTLDECKKLLARAETYERGLMAPYISVCLFAGLRPFEAQRLTFQQVNLSDREIRLEAWQTKTGQARVVKICDTLYAWLKKYDGRTFFPVNWRKHFIEVETAAGYGPHTAQRKFRALPPDIMRHTAISHYFRKTGSYGQTAEQFGNSEAIIKKHYQGRVSSEDTKAFYALLPMKGGRK